jgi:hypothetical protein
VDTVPVGITVGSGANKCIESCIKIFSGDASCTSWEEAQNQMDVLLPTVPVLVSHSYVHMSTVLSHTRRTNNKWTPAIRVDLARNVLEKQSIPPTSSPREKLVGLSAPAAARVVMCWQKRRLPCPHNSDRDAHEDIFLRNDIGGDVLLLACPCLCHPTPQNSFSAAKLHKAFYPHNNVYINQI